MKVLVTGAGGFVGKSLVPYLEMQGHAVVRAVRVAKEGNEVGIGEIDRLLGSLVDASAIRAELGWSLPLTPAAGLDVLVAHEGGMKRSHSCHPIS
ncbi:NAD-dependent epimerase/dehydratase family protein [Ferrovum sp.]|uniref:NAD-dependent epimerase/dehydratase family protein n=1 Tax=Ferrovum sp. TaxID=2609467 RepID=UPI00260D5262|nr:NAD-dependent epimerase/dehydratase family protein [Ferrovum sp.]